MRRLLTLLVLISFLAFSGTALGATVTGDPLLNPCLIEEIEATDRTGSDTKLATGTAGTNTYAAVWNADGDLVDGPGVPAVVALSNLASVAINTSLISDTANTDDLGTEALYWKKLFLASGLSFEGSTDDGYQTTFSITNPTTADRTITVPNSDQTIGHATSCAADAVDAITEIAAALKTGSDTKVVTGTAGVSGNFAQWNVDGDLVDGGGPGAAGSFGAAGTPTASAGIVAASTTNWLLIDGEGGVADDITELTCNALGDIIIVQAVDDSTTITMKDGAYLQLQADFIMENGADIMGLFVTTLGANDICTELFRANNGA
jgi:hypothetical protein